MSLADKAKIGGTWLLTLLLCAMFLMAGSAKFTSGEMWAGMFAGWGYPAWFAYFIGAVEVGAALALLVPALAAYAAAVIAVVMIGAAGTHFLAEQMYMFDVGVMVVALVLVWVRRSKAWMPAEAAVRIAASASE
jgi:putative oxidoreductase